MNNAIKFYDNQNNEDFNKKVGIESNYEYEMVESVSNAATSPFDAIEIIMNMAKTGKIDPWNIDVVKVYDEYMKKLKELNENRNLKLIGRTFVPAAALVNLKSRVLAGISLKDFEVEPEFDEYDDGYDGYEGYEGEQLQLPSSNVISFDEVLQRRTSTKLNRNRGITLNDLIRHIEFYEKLEKKRELKDAIDNHKLRMNRKYSKMTTSDILDMTQDEYIESLADKMEQNLNKILENVEMIELTELTLLGFSKTAAYIAILYLVSHGKFEIYQEEFYGDLFVKLPSKNIEESVENIEESAVSKGVKTLKAKLDKDKAILADEEIKDAC